jgi:aspartate aminotransferase
VNKYLKELSAPAAIAIADTVRKLESAGEKIAKMQTGEPCFDTPAYIKAAATKAMADGFTHYSYSQGLPALRESVATYYKKLYGTDITSDDIVLANGGVNSIYDTMLSLLNKKDEVIIFEPAWPQYGNIATIAGAKTIRISTRKTEFKITAGLLEKNISKKTRLVVINNPCNPTGLVYDNKLMNKLLKVAAAYDAYVMFDEVYHDNVYTKGFESVLASADFKKHKDRIIYINSFSKSFAMTGWRIGYAVLPKSLMPFYLKLSQNSITNVNAFIQQAAKTAIEKRNNHRSEFNKMNKLYEKRWLELGKIFKGLSIKTPEPGGAFYYFIPVKENGAEFAQWLLNKHKIAVVPGIAYGADFSKFIRISFSVDDYSYNYFLRALKKHGGQIFGFAK